MGCQKKDQDQKTQKKLQKMWAWSVVPMGWWTALGGRGSSAGRLPLLREEAALELETDNHHEENHDGGSSCLRDDPDRPDYCDYLKLDVMGLELEMEGKLQPSWSTIMVITRDAQYCDDQDFSKLDENDYHSYMQKTCDVTEKAILAKKNCGKSA